MSSDAEILEIVKNLQAKSEQTEASTKEHKPQGVNKATSWILKGLLVWVWIYFMLKYYSSIIGYIFSFTKFSVGSLTFALPDLAVNLLVILTTLFLNILIPVLLFPFTSQYSKQKWISKIVSWYIFPVIIIFAGSAIYSSVIDTNSKIYQDPVTGSQSLGTQVQTLFKNLACMINPTCAAALAQTKEATVASSNEYKVKFQKPNSEIMLSDLDDPNNNLLQDMQYSITTVDNIQLIGFSCFVNDKKEPFYHLTESQLNGVYDQTGQGKYITDPKLYCQNIPELKKIITSQTDKESLRIKAVLAMKITTKVTQKVPVLNYNYVVSKSTFNIADSPSKTRLQSVIDTLVVPDDYLTIKPNLPLSVTTDTENIKNIFPILVGQPNKNDFTYTLKVISNGDTGSFGKLFAGSVDKGMLNTLTPKNLLKEPLQLSTGSFTGNQLTGTWDSITNAFSIPSDGYTLSLKYTIIPTYPVTEKEIPVIEIPLTLYFENEQTFTLNVNGIKQNTPSTVTPTTPVASSEQQPTTPISG